MWLPNAKGLVADEGEIEGGAEAAPVADPIDCIPISPEAQLKAAKTLIEVEEYNVCWLVGFKAVEGCKYCSSLCRQLS